MHELGIVQQIFRAVQVAKSEVGASNVRTVTLLVGEARGFAEKWVQTYFDMLAEDTDVFGAKLKIETVPCTGKCMDCSEIFKTEPSFLRKIICPKCSSEKVEVCTGMELILKKIEFEFEDLPEVLE